MIEPCPWCESTSEKIDRLESEKLGMLTAIMSLTDEKQAAITLIERIKSGMNLNYQSIAEELEAIYKGEG